MITVEISGSYQISDGEKVVLRELFNKRNGTARSSSTISRYEKYPNLSLLRELRNKKARNAYNEMKKNLSEQGIAVTVE